MKAIVITSFGAADVLKVEEREKPVINENEVLIRVKAAGVNRPDVFQRKGSYPAPPDVPQDIPGLEVAGLIEELGANVKQWKMNDKVCALVAGAGYATYVKVNAGHCLPVPEGLSFVEAAGLPETVFTVWSNVFQRGRLQPGERFLIHGGSSGIGTTAIQLAKYVGAEVIVTVGSDEKGQYCLDLGADHFINYKREDFEHELKDQPVDVVLDMIGGSYFQKNIEVLRPDGRLVYINAMEGNTVSLNIMQMMRKRLHITGSTLRNREPEFKTALAQDILENVWPMFAKGQYKSTVFKVFPMEEANKAHELMESSQHLGKIILEMP
ncbi:NAD(P)H-quinone oxidoreductase [Pedobacter sp. PLR]|uniref:NAD(P)H-quinone oxidoreductase n=1 Tax=Pedobacter sp. PLR TaxID=2994465 RepID=UPI002245AA55|nr:NAD(P)H-quinone oxidoreductase [Pedobacter sp. PLR]MCX2452624.1 NAD(P)H-quinone oxidoreductase [Pedobacter sp. PLR]